MEHIRPHQVFALVEGSDRTFVNQIPLIDSLTTLESSVIATLLKVVKPASAFEFGTYRGETTRLIAENMPSSSVVYTLDLERLDDVDFEGDDFEWANRVVGLRRDFGELPAKVVQLLGDSYLFDPTPYEHQVGLVFVDGNHAVKYAAKDTKNGLRMLPQDGPSSLIWHDYGNTKYPELTAYLDDLSQERSLYHVEETMIAFCSNGFSISARQTGPD